MILRTRGSQVLTQNTFIFTGISKDTTDAPVKFFPRFPSRVACFADASFSFRSIEIYPYSRLGNYEQTCLSRFLSSLYARLCTTANIRYTIVARRTKRCVLESVECIAWRLTNKWQTVSDNCNNCRRRGAAPSSYAASLRLLLPSETRLWSTPCARRRHCTRPPPKTGTYTRVRATRHCFPSLSVGGKRDGGLDSRPVIKRLFRGFLNRILDFRSFRRGKRRKAGERRGVVA